MEGVNEILTAPQFSSEEGVEIVYETVEDSETYVGKLTVSYLTQTQVYWVTYTQQ